MIRARGVVVAAVAAVGACVAVSPADAGPADDVALIADTATGPADSFPHSFTALGDKVVFGAGVDGVGSGVEPWVTDGTDAGTMMLADTVPGTGSGAQFGISEFHVFKGHAYFTVDVGGLVGSELWRTDGTPAGTGLFADINGLGADSAPENFATMGEHMYFSAEGTSAGGRELWRTDGTLGTTELVEDIHSANGAGGDPDDLTPIDGTLYFSATDETLGRELFKSDGEPAGDTVPVADIAAGATSGNPELLIEHNGELFFRAGDTATNVELWKSDGTTLGTDPVKDIASGADGSLPGELTSAGGELLFAAYSAPGFADRELWRSDGSTAGTVKVKDIAPGSGGSSPDGLVGFGADVYFAASGPNGRELWRSDGSEPGTVEVADINPGGGSSSPQPGVGFNGFLYFFATHPSNGLELWQTDGTAAGTTIVEDLIPGPTASISPTPPVRFGNSLIFSGRDSLSGFEPFRADDTTAPDTSIVSGPEAGSTVADTTPSFGFAADEAPVTFACSVDGADFGPCSGPGAAHTTAELAPGAHSFAVRAVDAVGLTDPTPAVRSFLIASPPDDDPGDPPDTAVLDPFVKAKKKQRQKDEMIVKLKLGAGELVSYVGKGKATVDGRKGGAKLAKQTGTAEAGERVKLKLRAAKEDAGDEVLDAIAAGEKAEATLKVKLIDQAGNRFKQKLTVELK